MFGRKTVVRVSMEYSKVESGNPEGSICNPVLFNIMINDIFEQIEPKGKSFFADDGASWARGQNLKFLQKKIVKMLFCKKKNKKELIKSTYFTQREEINNGASIKNLSQEWPFLSKEVGMAAHFRELTGMSFGPSLPMWRKRGHIS